MRLRMRLQHGDPDITADEIQAAITMAEAKRSELTAAPVIPDTARVLSMLPKAAAAYRAMIAQGVSKHPEAATRARAAIRQLVGGEIQLQPEKAPDGTRYLVARFGLHQIALLGGDFATVRSAGSGGRI